MKVFPIANKWGRSTISLSLSASVSNEDVERIINSVKKEIQIKISWFLKK